MNGALGTVVAMEGNGARVEFDDGTADRIAVRDLENLGRGWAISVHKAQGSAFRRVIVPVTGSRLVDRSLFYTALTRGVETVVFVGEEAELRRIVREEPRVSVRPDTLCLDG